MSYSFFPIRRDVSARQVSPQAPQCRREQADAERRKGELDRRSDRVFRHDQAQIDPALEQVVAEADEARALGPDRFHPRQAGDEISGASVSTNAISDCCGAIRVHISVPPHSNVTLSM